MPTENPRITFTVSEEMKDQINEYQFNNRIKNQSQAILSLIKVGMDSLENESKSSSDNSFQDNSGSSEILYLSRPTGDVKADEIRKYLHETIDQLSDSDLEFFKDITVRLKRDENLLPPSRIMR